jgi:hypothetical protein
MENNQQRNDISELKVKVETAYYQVKNEIQKRPRLHKLQNMLNIKNN